MDIGLHYLIVIELISCYVICLLHFRIGFELFLRLCNVLRCDKAQHMDIGLHYIIVIELICLLCNMFVTLQNWLRINYVIISASIVLVCSPFGCPDAPSHYKQKLQKKSKKSHQIGL